MRSLSLMSKTFWKKFIFFSGPVTCHVSSHVEPPSIQCAGPVKPTWKIFGRPKHLPVILERSGALDGETHAPGSLSPPLLAAHFLPNQELVPTLIKGPDQATSGIRVLVFSLFMYWWPI